MKVLKQDYNETTGITTQYILHPNGKITVRGLQDAEPIFNENSRRLNSVSSKSRRDYGEGLGIKVASIPMGLVEQLARERGLNILTCSDAQLKALLNDSEFNKLRTAHGKV
jgi:hypothetical protein